jgi:phosphoribosyl 1,2-cyclic phosphodiesterase
MSPSLSILASGSSGNCSVLRSPGGVMLIDCGIGPRAASSRMKGLGIGVADVRAICLTHLDSDHFNLNWAGEIIKRQIQVFCHETCIDELSRRIDDPDFARLIFPFDGENFSPIPGICSQAIPLPHDQCGSHGFVFKGFGSRIGYATDLGRVEMDLIDRFSDLDVLAIESNYDPDLQRNSPRPWFLKNRIMGGHGHLSNQQAYNAVKQILDRQSVSGHLPGHIVLLHRSMQCNCPMLVRRLFNRDIRIAPRLVLSEQDRRTEWLCARPVQSWTGKQMDLQWG